MHTSFSNLSKISVTHASVHIEIVEAIFFVTRKVCSLTGSAHYVSAGILVSVFEYDNDTNSRRCHVATKLVADFFAIDFPFKISSRLVAFYWHAHVTNIYLYTDA